MAMRYSTGAGESYDDSLNPLEVACEGHIQYQWGCGARVGEPCIGIAQGTYHGIRRVLRTRNGPQADGPGGGMAYTKPFAEMTDHEKDLAIIYKRMLALATRHSWCSQFWDAVEACEKRMSQPFPVRRKHTVTVTFETSGTEAPDEATIKAALEAQADGAVSVNISSQQPRNRF